MNTNLQILRELIGNNKPVHGHFFYVKPIFFLLCVLFPPFFLRAATFTTNNASVTWNNAAHWTLNSGTSVLNYPVAGDIVNIQANQSVTVTANAACASITWSGTLTASRTLTVNAGVTLDVSGDINFATPAAGFNRTLSVLGTLNCESFIMGTSGNNAHDVILSIGTAGTANINGNLVMPSAFARHHVDMVAGGGSVLNIGGNVGNAAAPTAAGGGFTNPRTINLNGTLPQNYWPGTAGTAALFKINNAAGVILRLAVTVSALTIGDITANSLFKDSGNTVACTGTLELNNGSTYRLGRYSGTGGTATTFPAFATRNIDPGTTIEYAHTNAAQTVSVTPNYANLVFSGVSKSIGTATNGILNVQENFTINSGATCNAAAFTNTAINIGGDFINSGTFTTGTGLVTFNGTSNQDISSVNTLTFNGGLTIGNSGGAIVTNTNATIAIPTGDVMTINNGSIFYAGANIINGAGTFTLASGGALGIGSAGGIAAVGTNSGNVQTTTARNYNTGANYIYNGIVNQTEGNGLPATVNNLTVNNTGGDGSNTITMVSNVSVSGNLSVLNGVLDLVSFTANRGAAGGVLTIANGAKLVIGGTNTLPSNYNTHSIGLTSTVEYNGTTNTVAALNSSQSYGNLIISASGATTGNNFSVSGTMTVSGSFIASAGTVTMNNAASAIDNSGVLTFFNLTVSATPTAQSQYNTSFTVANTLATSGAANFSPSGGTITMSGAAGAINNTTGTLGFSSLLITGTTVSSTGNFSVGNTMTVTSTFAPAATSVISGAGTLTGTGTVRVTRIAATPSFSAQYTMSNKALSDLTVNYIGAGAQTVSAEDYGTLVISTNGTRTVTFVNGGTIRVSNIFTPTTTNTTYVVTGNNFEYNGNSAQTITAFAYHNLIISNTGAKTVLAGTTVSCLTIELNDAAVLTLPDTAVLNVTL